MSRHILAVAFVAFCLFPACEETGSSGGDSDVAGSDSGGGDTSMSDTSGDTGGSDGGGEDTGNTDTGSTDTGSSGGTCDPLFGAGDACGGDLEGVWTLTNVCGDTSALEDGLQDACPTATVDVDVDASGTLTMSSTTIGTFQRDVSVTVTVTADIPATCAQIVGGCASVESILNMGEVTVTCADAGGGACTCETSDAFDTDTSGAYTVSDGVVTIVSTEMQTFYYCVDGDSLSAREFPADAAEADYTQFYTR